MPFDVDLNAMHWPLSQVAFAINGDPKIFPSLDSGCISLPWIEENRMKGLTYEAPIIVAKHLRVWKELRLFGISRQESDELTCRFTLQGCNDPVRQPGELFANGPTVLAVTITHDERGVMGHVVNEWPEPGISHLVIDLEALCVEVEALMREMVRSFDGSFSIRAAKRRPSNESIMLTRRLNTIRKQHRTRRVTPASLMMRGT